MCGWVWWGWGVPCCGHTCPFAAAGAAWGAYGLKGASMMMRPAPSVRGCWSKGSALHPRFFAAPPPLPIAPTPRAPAPHSGSPSVVCQEAYLDQQHVAATDLLGVQVRL